jgi:trimethylamine--corrinoid protein Co-methyltransferase
MIIDDEIIGTTERILDGMDFDEEALALDVIDKVGPGGIYLSQRHTMSRFRKEHYVPAMSDRDFYSGWIRKGSRQMRDRAREKAEELLGTSRLEPIGKDTEKTVDSILDEAARSAARNG